MISEQKLNIIKSYLQNGNNLKYIRLLTEVYSVTHIQNKNKKIKHMLIVSIINDYENNPHKWNLIDMRDDNPHKSTLACIILGDTDGINSIQTTTPCIKTKNFVCEMCKKNITYACFDNNKHKLCVKCYSCYASINKRDIAIIKEKSLIYCIYSTYKLNNKITYCSVIDKCKGKKRSTKNTLETCHVIKLTPFDSFDLEEPDLVIPYIKNFIDFGNHGHKDGYSIFRKITDRYVEYSYNSCILCKIKHNIYTEGYVESIKSETGNISKGYSKDKKHIRKLLKNVGGIYTEIYCKECYLYKILSIIIKENKLHLFFYIFNLYLSECQDLKCILIDSIADIFLFYGKQ